MTAGTNPAAGESADRSAGGGSANSESADSSIGGGSAVGGLAGGGPADSGPAVGESIDSSVGGPASRGSAGGSAVGESIDSSVGGPASRGSAGSGGRHGSIERFGSGGPWEDVYGYSRVVRAGDLVVTAGCTATVDGQITGIGDAHAQTLTAFRIALDALAAAGASLDEVIRTRMYIIDADHADAAGRAHGELFGWVRPAATLVVVAGLLHPDHLVEVEVEAYVGGRPRIVLV
jgi:enamine deaminase RidA (YjgF/YER057c/UK114 family)